MTIDIPKEEALQYMLTAGAVMPLAEGKKSAAQKNSRKASVPMENEQGAAE